MSQNLGLAGAIGYIGRCLCAAAGGEAVLKPAALEISKVEFSLNKVGGRTVANNKGTAKTSKANIKAVLEHSTMCYRPMTAVAVFYPSEAERKSRSFSPGFTGARSICSGTWREPGASFCWHRSADANKYREQSAVFWHIIAGRLST